MGYDNFDHVGWVQESIAAFQRPGKKHPASDLKRKAEGRGWLAAPAELTSWQRRAITMLGIAFGGIYNAPIEWDLVTWRGGFLGVKIARDLATWDGDALTEIVVMAHLAALRVDISPAMRHLEIMIHPREPSKGDGTQGMAKRHPTFQQLVERTYSRFPPGHHIWHPDTFGEIYPEDVPL